MRKWLEKHTYEPKILNKDKKEHLTNYKQNSFHIYVQPTCWYPSDSLSPFETVVSFPDAMSGLNSFLSVVGIWGVASSSNELSLMKSRVGGVGMTMLGCDFLFGFTRSIVAMFVNFWVMFDTVFDGVLTGEGLLSLSYQIHRSFSSSVEISFAFYSCITNGDRSNKLLKSKCWTQSNLNLK